MKKIIEGKRYDTETATLIASYSNGLNRSDFRHLYEDLFITKNGQWFMEYKGGVLSNILKAMRHISFSSTTKIKEILNQQALHYDSYAEVDAKIEEIEQKFTTIEMIKSVKMLMV